MTATAALTADLQRQVLALEDDLRERVAADVERTGRWKVEHGEAVAKDRTAAPWTTWRDDRVTQAAVAWVLTTVFIRFCEDNGLVGPVWITGPGPRRQEALDAQLAYFRAHPEDTDREWLLQAVTHLAKLPATAALLDTHSALWWVSPSGNAVTALLDFWRRRGDDGALVHDLADPDLSTRFLGDLYQDLSQYAKDTYALLQTPVFVEEFILDRTLEPALAERPLDGFRMIDPTCGSGHFLLGAFDRLLDRWHRAAPALDAQARVQTALDAINGVDLNPFAVAIARFRLTVAALKACGLSTVEDAPAFTLHLAVGDSLIHGPDPDTIPGLSSRAAFMPFTYATEDGPLLLEMLEEGRYDVVVGNPPYKTVADKALNQIYRSKYGKMCKGSYALTVPFMVQFFALAKAGDRPGWVGQITSNSFMKREFGAPLIENFFTQVDLRLIVDSSGVYIPNHGTPTIIVAGCNQSPVSATVRAILGVRGESGRPDNPAEGAVWQTIVQHVDVLGWDDRWITVVDLQRDRLALHPWSLSGGGSHLVLEQVERTRAPGAGLKGWGFSVVTREDSAYALDAGAVRRLGVRRDHTLPMAEGTDLRDWQIGVTKECIWPYDATTMEATLDLGATRVLWPLRTILRSRVAFGRTQIERGLTWYEYSMFFRDKFAAPLRLVFAMLSTHNHAVVSREKMVFKHSCHVLPTVEEDVTIATAAILNSSTACFWLKENSHNKGEGGGARVDAGYAARGEPFRETYEFTGTTLQAFPLPAVLPLKRGRKLDRMAQESVTHTPSAACGRRTPSSVILLDARRASERVRRQMIALQEELDWEAYKLYGLVQEDLTCPDDELPTLAPGERAFEIMLARVVCAGEETTTWFTHQGYTPITEIPEHWPAAYRELVQRRLDLIASDPHIRLLEKPEYKRRWAQESWEKRQERAVREWLLDRLEDKKFWFDGQGRPQPRSVGQLADEVARDTDLVSVLALWEGRPDIPVTQSLTRLLADEAVPFLAAYRYKDAGMRKREAWEETWALQRREDAGEQVGTIPVPPKYTSADFRKQSYWHHRGKLDVPKERFILYPNAGRETDPTPLLGWAGWDHAQQSLALSLIIGAREAEGAADATLVPLVAGLSELQPWVQQWHGEVDPTYGISLAAFCAEQLTARAAQVSMSLPDLAAWRPAAPTRGRRPRGAG